MGGAGRGWGKHPLEYTDSQITAQLEMEIFPSILKMPP